MGPASLSKTTSSLLRGLRDPANRQAWRELCERCEPIMRATALRIGLQPAEADDAVQAALASFFDAYRRGLYDPARGRLSAFLLTILRSRAIEILRQSARRREVAGDSALVDVPSESETERIWSDERQRRILALAVQTLREEGADERLIRAFELYAVRGVDAAAVGSELGMSREEIYDAKYRLTRRLQPIVARLDELYEDL